MLSLFLAPQRFLQCFEQHSIELLDVLLHLSLLILPLKALHQVSSGYFAWKFAIQFSKEFL